MRYVISLLFLSVTAFLFFAIADPKYREVGSLRAERDSFDSALQNLRELAVIQDELLVRYNTISVIDRTRLNKMVPSEVAFDQLMVEINQLAAQNGLAFKEIDIIEEGTASPGRGRNAAPVSAEIKSGVQSPLLNFSVGGTYQGLRLFLEDLESHIRITDLGEISFDSPADELGFIGVEFKGMTYWVK